MAVVGSAEVVVRAITSKVRDDIQRAFRSARADVESAGRDHGKAYSEGFTRGMNGDNIRNSIASALNRSVGDAALIGNEAGQHMGQGATEGFTESFNIGTPMTDAMDRDSRGAAEAARRAGERAGAEAETSFGAAGNRGGSAFGRGFLRSDFARSAEQASAQFTIMLGTGNLVGPMIASIVPALSAAASGLFALGAAASQAVGALAVLPGSFAAVAQGAATLKLAFSGVGDAISAGVKQTTSFGGAANQAAKSAASGVASARAALARAQQSSASSIASAELAMSRAHQDAVRRMSDARQGLQRAYADAARASADAARQVADAEGEVRDAQAEVLSVQRELTAARREAAEQLQQLGFDAEDAALAEQRASLRLQDAYQALLLTQNLPPDNRARVEAELAYKEAELSYRQAKDRASDLASEQKKAAKAGIEGSNEVVAARQRIADAEGRLADAQRSLGDARRDQAQTDIDNQQRIADAQQDVADTQLQNARAIADAERGLTQARQNGAQQVRDAQARLTAALKAQRDATSEATGAANAYGSALAQLSGPAQTFVRYLVSLRDEFKRLRAEAGAELFPRLIEAIRPMVSSLLPILQTQLRETGRVLGDMAIGFSDAVTSSEGLTRIRSILAANNRILDIFNEKTETGNTAIGNLALVALRLLRAMQPLTRRFAIWVQSLTVGAAVATDSGREMDKLRGFFNRAGDTAAQLGDIFGNLWQALMDLGSAATPAGQGLLNSFEKATASLDRMIRRASRSGELQDFFRDASKNARALGNLFNLIGLEALKLGDNKGIREFSNGIRPAIKNFAEIGDRMTESGGSLARFINKISELLLMLTQTGQIERFIDTLTTITSVVIDTARWIGRAANRFDDFFEKLTGIDNVTGKIGTLVLMWMAVHRAIAFAFRPVSFFFRALIGGPIAVMRGLSRLTGFFRGGIGAAVGRAAAAVKNGFRQMILGSDGAKRALEIQMGVDREKTLVLEALERQAILTAGALREVQAAGAPVGAAPKAAAAAAAPSVAKTGTAAAGAATAAGAVPLAGATVATGAATKTAGRFGKLGAVFSKLATPLKALSGVFLRFGSVILRFLGGPIGALILALPLIIKGLQALYGSSPEFKKFVDNIVDAAKQIVHWFGDVLVPIFDKVKDAIVGALVDYVVPALNSFFGFLNSAIPVVARVVGDVFGDIVGVISRVFIPYWNNVVMPAFQLLRTVVPPVMRFVGRAIGILFNVIKFFITRVFIPYWNKVLIPAIKILWRVVSFNFKLVMGVVRLLFNLVKFQITRVFMPVWRGILWPAIKMLFTIAKAIFGKVYDVFRDAIRGMKIIWERVLRPTLNLIKDKFGELRQKVVDVVNGIKSKWADFKDALETLWTRIRDRVNDIKDKFGEIKAAVVAAFSGLGAASKDKLNDFINFLNTKLIDNINKVTSKFGLTIGHIPRAADGGRAGDKYGIGRVRGPGGPREDRVPMMVSPDEFILPAHKSRRIGYENLEYMRKYGRMPGTGGATGTVAVPRGISTGGILGGLGHAFSSIENLAQKGVGYTLEKLVDGAHALMKTVGLGYQSGKGFTLVNFFNKIMDKLAESAKSWGQTKDAEADQRYSSSIGLGTGTGPGAVWYALRTAGFSAIQAAGIMGNMQSESGFDPYIVQGGGHSMNPAAAGSGGYGLVQWTPGKKLIPYLHGEGPSIQSEIRALREQLAGKGSSPEGAAGAALRAAKTVAEAARAFELKYERHAGPPQPNRVTQALAWYHKYRGVSLASLSGAIMGGKGSWAYPLSKRYPITQWPNSGHNPPWSVDIGSPNGTRVNAVGGGRVSIAADIGDRSYGRYIKIGHDDGSWSLYAHLAKMFVRAGMAVKAGQQIGLSNNYGNTTGPHLHFELYDILKNTYKAMLKRGVRLASGGVVQATNGGIHALIGEAGKNERVEPLDREGFSKRDRAILQAVKDAISTANNRGGGVIHVHPSPGMDERELAELILRRQQFSMRS